MCCGGIGSVITAREISLSYGQLEPNKNKYGNFGVILSYGTAYKFENIAATTASYTQHRGYNPVVNYGRQIVPHYNSKMQTTEIHPEIKDKILERSSLNKDFDNLVYNMINELQEKIQRRKNGEREILAINEQN